MLKKLFNMIIGRPNKLLGIDIGDDLIKIIEMKHAGDDFRITVAKSAPLPSGVIVDGVLADPKAFKDFFVRLLQLVGTSAKHIVLSVGPQEPFRRELTFPFMSKEELETSIRFEVERQVPYPDGSFYYDYVIVERNEEISEMKVILLATPKKMLEELTDIFKEVGLTLVAIDTNSLATHRSLDKADNSLVVNITAEENTKIIIYQNAVPVVVRSVPIAGNRLNDIIMSQLNISNEEAKILRKKNTIQQKSSVKEVAQEENSLEKSLYLFNNELGAEIQRTVEYYSVQHSDINVEKVYLLGEGANVDGLLESLCAVTETTIAFHALNKRVIIADHLSLTPAHCSRMAVAIGLAMYKWQ